MVTFSRKKSRALNLLIALFREQMSPHERCATPRADSRQHVTKLVDAHGRFAVVRDIILSRARSNTIERRHCDACDGVTEHKGGICCHHRSHLVKYCDACEKDTVHVRRTGRCLEPGHVEPQREWCRGCCTSRFFNKGGCCKTCGTERYETILRLRRAMIW